MLWPDVELRASYGFREPLMGVRQDGMVSATAAFMLPIFGRSRELVMGAEMDAMAEASRLERRDAELSLRAEVTAACAAPHPDAAAGAVAADDEEERCRGCWWAWRPWR